MTWLISIIIAIPAGAAGKVNGDLHRRYAPPPPEGEGNVNIKVKSGIWADGRGVLGRHGVKRGVKIIGKSGFRGVNGVNTVNTANGVNIANSANFVNFGCKTG